MSDDKEQAAMNIYIAIKRSSKSMRRALSDKTPIKNDEACRKFTTHILNALKGYQITKIKEYGAGDAITDKNKP